MQKGELKLRVQDDEVTFNVFKAMRHPTKRDACFLVETVEAIVSSQSGPTDPLEASLVQSDSENLSEEAVEYVNLMNSFEPNGRKYYEPLGENTKMPLPSSKQPPKVKQKPLPCYLRYAYLGGAWSLADLKGIRPSMCMHRILLEDGHKQSMEAQRRLNPTMKEVVREEVLKWLDAGVIYPICDSTWVSLVQVVPKK